MGKYNEKKKSKATLVIVLIAVLGIAIYGYLYYDSSQKLDFEFKEFRMVHLGGNNYQLQFEGFATTTGAVAVHVEEAEYTITIQDTLIGNGVILELYASNEGGYFNMTLNISPNLSQLAILLGLSFGAEYDMTIQITKVVILFIPISTDITITQKIEMF